MIKKTKCLFAICLVLITIKSIGQNTQIRIYGHVDNSSVFNNSKLMKNSFELGEHDMFITSTISNRISFLGEFVVKSDQLTTFSASIERARLKLNYLPKHSVIIGKIHSPVNYWNDVYHHGRVFFPTINRPKMFGHFIPLHTTGLRLQGQNIGKLRFGYDFVVGNGLSSTDVNDLDIFKSITAAVQINPSVNTRISASYYYDIIRNNIVGAHGGHVHTNHSNHTNHNSMYQGDIGYQIFSISIAYFGKKVEILNENALNISTTKVSGNSNNLTNFLYLGYKATEKFTPYVLFDFIDITEKDLHLMPKTESNAGLAFRYEFDANVILKSEAIRTTNHKNNNGFYTLNFQIAYGF